MLPRFWRRAAGLVGPAYFYGAMLGAFGLLWHVISRGGLPPMAWWQYLLAPLSIGLIAFGGEYIVEVVQRSTGFGSPGHSRLRNRIELLILLVVMAAVIIGPALYSIANS